MQQRRKRIGAIMLSVIALIMIGTTGYFWIEGWSLLDSIYMTMIIITTIGFREVHELSVPGKVFTVIYSFIGFMFLAGAVSIVGSAIVEGRLLGMYRRKRMDNAISKLKGHIIVCGAGDVGKHVARELLEIKRRLVLVDKEEKNIERVIEELGDPHGFILHVEGDATREEILTKAGIESAAGVITCLPQDSLNLFIALTAKKLNPDTKLACYVVDEVNVSKFFTVGVEEVVSGDFIVGRKLAHAMVNPNVLAFLDEVNVIKGDHAFYVNGNEVPEKSPLIGQSLREVSIPHHCGLVVIAIRKSGSERFVFNPRSETKLSAGDVLISLGQERHVKSLKNYLATGKVNAADVTGRN